MNILDILKLSGIGTRTSMQDAGLTNASTNGSLHWFIVCDGIGGNPYGDVASKFITAVVDEYLTRTLKKETQLTNADYIHTIFAAIQDQLRNFLQDHPAYKNMGSTLCVLILSSKNLYTIWSGDSRVYLFRGGACIWDSMPHSWPYELYQKGILTLEDARVSETNYLTASVCNKPEPIRFDYETKTIKPNDILLICTDGIWGLFEHAELIKMFSDKSFKKISFTLKQYLKNYANDNYYGYIIHLSEP